jgi:hypothetical protein
MSSGTLPEVGNAEQKSWCWVTLQTHHFDFKLSCHWLMPHPNFLLFSLKMATEIDN